MTHNGKKRLMGWVWFLSIMTVILVLAAIAPYDDTDAAPERSGLGLKTDHGTGCQYLVTAFGLAITPRMKADGTQVCDRR